MTKKTEGFSFFDPFGLWRATRDATLDAWSQTTTNMVNTEAYANMMGLWLDAYLTTSTPFQQMTEKMMALTLMQLNLPARADITNVAERLTNVEMRLDDLDAKLDALKRAARQSLSTDEDVR